MNRASGEVDRFGQKADGLRGVLSRLKVWIVGAFSAAAIWRTSNALVQVNSDLETYEATLRTVTGSQETAIQKLEYARRLAAETPFQLDEIIQATTKLEAYGITAENVLRPAGDAAAALGKRINDAVEAIADAQTGEVAWL